MLISNGQTIGSGADFTSCCPLPVAPSARASNIINWKMDPVGLPAPNTAPSVLPSALPLSPSGNDFVILYKL